MSDLETKLDKARNRERRYDARLSREKLESFDAAAAIAREVVAEKDRVISRLYSFAEIQRYQAALAEKDAQIARLEAQMRDEVCTCCGRERKGFAREVTLGEPVLSFEFTPEEPAVTTFDFGDGNGAVPAHKHPNGGGWVADTATVDDTAYVGPNAQVYGDALVFGNARVFENARVFGYAQVYGYAYVFGNARVSEDAQVFGNAWVSENAWVTK
jgi:UDP-3-O-[3-hydroxymyristoyl] glucosamine N-acyltransferase